MRIFYPYQTLVFLLLGSFLALGSGHKAWAQTKADEKTATKPYPAIVQPVSLVDFDSAVSYSGFVRPIRLTSIRATQEGVVEKLLFKDGSKVKANMALMRIDSQLNAGRLKTAENGVKGSLLDVYQQEIDMKNRLISFRALERQEANAKLALEAEQDLYDKGYSSDAQLNNAHALYDQVYASYLSAKLLLNDIDATKAMASNIGDKIQDQMDQGVGYENLRAQSPLGRIYLPLDRALLNFENARVAFIQAKTDYRNNEAVTPFEGTLLRTWVDLGQNVTKGQNLADFGDLGTLLVDIYISSEDMVFLNSMKPQKPKIELAFDSLPGQSFTGSLSNLSMIADPQSRSFRATVEIPNKEGKIQIGENARLRVGIYSFKQQVIIPINAILQEEKGPYVFVSVGNKAKKRPISLGKLFGEKAVVKAGLNSGELLVVRGQQFIKEDDNLLLQHQQ